MFSLMIFKIFSFIAIGALAYFLFVFVLNTIRKRAGLSAVVKKILIIAVTFVILIFGGASVLPYMLNQMDSYRISAAYKNIDLMNAYIDEYTSTARKQIEDYQELLTEMARRSTATQLQYWSQQSDEVGNALTDRIKFFKDSIMEQQIEVNMRKSKIEARESNKFFFMIKGS